MVKQVKPAVALAALIALAGTAQAQQKLSIGFLTDMSGVYADLDGKEGATARQHIVGA